MYKQIWGLDLDAFALMAVLVGFTVVCIASVAYSHYDRATATATAMGMGIIVDKEHVIRFDDGQESHEYYFQVSASGTEKRVRADESVFRSLRLGSPVIIDTRVGGLSKQVVGEFARPFEGAEAK